ncbi:MAG TPA: DUF4386 domain-containing protein [Ktedonobacteraceae bacterium]
MNAQVGYISLVFDGLWLLLIGYFIFRSTFLPRILGALVALVGLGWLTLLALPLGTYLYSYIQVVGILGEASLMLWLLVMGVNAQRWKERPAQPFTGRFFGADRHIRRGGGGAERSGDACVALAGGERVHSRIRATQASPLHPTLPPPLRVRSRFRGDIIK